ncbi:SPOR domain-containing protein [Shewanella violacea]|uniref:Cell division protein FtsN, putative n=1 Tax=Shewanella violacea (strain JCM 10179 / CIP 106290 / LMG 19151 / DSS12) TaxID=637905 RepID=D4ZEL6_SHEVD|nr:SPOR domain-containing protein [Shewanella violacea]BAJ00246.1 cell division protein FtsN, putative [Shewanella violacea DSS12]
MTNRDYANRKPSRKGKAKSKTTRRKSKAPAPRRFPLVLLLVTLGLVTGFGYFLWTINNSAKDLDEGEAAVAEQSVVKPTQKKDPKALPPKPKEKWTYQKELVNMKVEVDIPEVSGPAHRYRMQCGSFRTQPQADAMKAVIAFQGLDSNITKAKGTTGDWYKVSLGPYDRKRLAEKHRHVLQKAGINGCFLMFVN